MSFLEFKPSLHVHVLEILTPNEIFRFFCTSSGSPRALGYLMSEAAEGIKYLQMCVNIWSTMYLAPYLLSRSC